MNDILKYTSSKIKPCPSTLIITPTQTMLRLVRDELTKSGQKLTQLQLIADCIALHTCEKVSVLGPVVGISAINLSLAPLLQERIETVYLVSVAGSKNFAIGDILQGKKFKIQAGDSYQANTELDNFKSVDVLTVNDPYQDNPSLADTDIIEMEAAEVARLCLKYNKKFYSLFCVSDNWQNNNNWQQGFSSDKFMMSLKELVKIIVSRL